jgi:tetratricopeptide (TPR) repeat protein
MDLHQLPVGDERTSVLLTHGLEQLQQAQQLVDARLDQLGAAQGPLSRQDRNLTRLQAARIAYVRGELYRLTAIKRTEDDPTRQAYLDSAVQIFTDMRKTFSSIDDAELARVGLSRCYRLLGQLDAAMDILKPILRQPDDTTQQSQMNLWRAAIIEELEILLIEAPEKALAQAGQWMAHEAFTNQANWMRSLGRIDALAAVQLALLTPNAPSVQLAVTKLRDSDLPAAMQLQYMVQLELASNIPVVTTAQRNDWVLLLVDTLPAQQAVDRIKAQLPDLNLLNVRANMAYGVALWQVGQLPQAVDCFDRAMRFMDDNDPLKNQAALWYAQCLYQQVIQTDNPSIRMRARAALSRLVQTHPIKATRVEALRQWVSLEQTDEGVASAASVIQQNMSLVGDDPYLHYVLFVNRWERIKQAAAEMGTQTESAREQARTLIDEAAKMVSVAQAAHEPKVAGGLLQLQARIYASPLILEPTKATALLDEAAPLLGQSQLQLKALFLIQSKEPQQLWELIQAAGTDIQLDGGAWVLVIDAITELALRQDDDSLIHERAIQLAITAWNNKLDTQGKIRIAQDLVKLQSWDVCLTLLGEELIPGTAPQLNLVIGQALLGLNKDMDQAVAVLNQVVTDLPDSPDAHLWLAMAYARGEQHALACGHYRAVRKLEKPATVPWWRATLGLAQSLSAMGQNQAAKQILQVTLTLYPVIGDDALAQELVQLLGRLQKS